ncbi:MAG: wax ester/triacylglycerol synthase family O-acyltransferase [Actinobacteria bacterium]|nr:wax ester/triacylglycerol synthase family O-acyltransferase [Actinomycetota bacterium]
MPITDAAFLMAETRSKPLHVGGLQLFKLPADATIEDISRLFDEALAHGDVDPRLRIRPTHLFGVGPLAWSEDTQLDLEYHVRHSAVPRPGRIRELLALVSRLHGTLLDRNRPLWEGHLIEGLEDGGTFAVYSKVHHSLMDGVSAMRRLERSLTPDPDERGVPPFWALGRSRGSGPAEESPSLPARAVRAAAEGVKTVAGVTQASVRALVEGIWTEAAALPYQAPASMLNVPITGARRFAADSWSIERLHAVAKATDATVNDVLLGMCAGALRRYLLSHDALPAEPLVAMVPVSLRDEADESAGNQVGLILCNLGTHHADPERRFEVVRRSMREGKLRLRGLTPAAVMALSAVSFAPVILGPLTNLPGFRRPPFNVIISNVPGPREKLYWNGAEMTGIYPVSVPYDGQALNITVTSYAGSLEVGLVGCRRSVPSLQKLLDHLEESLTELERASGVA